MPALPIRVKMDRADPDRPKGQLDYCCSGCGAVLIQGTERIQTLLPIRCALCGATNNVTS